MSLNQLHLEALLMAGRTALQLDVAEGFLEIRHQSGLSSIEDAVGWLILVASGIISSSLLSKSIRCIICCSCSCSNLGVSSSAPLQTLLATGLQDAVRICTICGSCLVCARSAPTHSCCKQCTALAWKMYCISAQPSLSACARFSAVFSVQATRHRRHVLKRVFELSGL